MDLLPRRFVAASVSLLLACAVGCGDDTGGAGGSGGGSGGAAASTSDASSDTTDASASTGEAGTCTLDPATDPECAEVVSGGVTYETGYACTGDAEPECDHAFGIGNDHWCCPPA